MLPLPSMAMPWWLSGLAAGIDAVPVEAGDALFIVPDDGFDVGAAVALALGGE
jgi:hypothetical protein